MTIDSLTTYGIQQPLIDAWKKTGVTTLTECHPAFHAECFPIRLCGRERTS